MIDVAVIGCGGIGGYLLELLPQVMACIRLDKMPKSWAQRALDSEGLEIEGLNPFRSLILVDGDSFSGHNALRQAGVTGSKLALQMAKIRKKDAFTTWLSETKLVGYETYIKPSNINSILRGPDTYVFLCVDNHKTRYEVSRWAEEQNSVRNIVLINGGNEKVTGNVTVFQKFGSTYYDPPLYDIYPEIKDGTDRRPDEVACGTVSLANDQTAIINNMIASIMLNMFRKIVMEDQPGKGLEEKTRFKDKYGNNLTARKNEVIINLETNTMVSLSHKRIQRETTDTVENLPEGEIELN